MAKLCLMHCKNNTVCMSIYIYTAYVCVYIYIQRVAFFVFLWTNCTQASLKNIKLLLQYLVVPHKPFQLVPAHFAPGPLQRADRHKDAAIRRPDGFGTGCTGCAAHKIPQTTSLPIKFAPQNQFKKMLDTNQPLSNMLCFCAPRCNFANFAKSTNKHVSHAVIPVITGRVFGPIWVENDQSMVGSFKTIVRCVSRI